MFSSKSKRRRATSNPAHSQPPPSAAASLAASQAFLQDRRQSHGALSSAAAAAALRTHATTPTPVGQTMTKRMVRKGSTSSHGSAANLAPGMRRHSSSGSMTERSFRAPSPGRGSPVVEHPSNAPPVPALPRIVPAGVTQRRASSLEPSYRGSPIAGRGSGRGVSVDAGARATPPRGQRVMSLSQVPEDDQDPNSRSINFSRPISPSPSPTLPLPLPLPSARAGHSGWFAAPVVNADQGFRERGPKRPTTSDATLQYDAHNAWQYVQNAADRPVSTKKTQLAQGVEGSRLSTASMRAKPSGTSLSSSQAQHASGPINPNSPDAVYDPSTRSFIRKQDAMALFRQLQPDEEPVERYVLHQAPPPRPQSGPQQYVLQYAPVPFRDVRHLSPSPPPRSPRRAEAAPRRALEPPAHTQPIIEEQEEIAWPTPPGNKEAQSARQESDDFAGSDVRPPIYADTSRKLDSPVPEPMGTIQEVAASPKVTPLHNQDSSYPRLGTPRSQTPTEQQTGRGRGSVGSDRGFSQSPPRNAHFAPITLEVPNGILHHPPGRSVSPAKSALKSSPSTSRQSSPPTTNGRVTNNVARSEASDTISEDPYQKKKKAVRVSFEEAPVIAGTSAYGGVEDDTPVSPSGLSQSRWTTNLEDSLDDVMTPRPALPSFGSIRGTNRRQTPDDSPEEVSETLSSSTTTFVGSVSEPMEVSSDHAIGSIVAYDLASKKILDPIPPQVTSVEGNRYVSDSDSSIVPKHYPEPETLAALAESKPSVTEVPVIAIQPATPGLMEKSKPEYQPPLLPGGWQEEEQLAQAKAKAQEDREQDNSKALTGARGQALTFAPLPEPDTTDDDESIYSDAYEELTDTEDGGFASIDMIVESPLVYPLSGVNADSNAAEPARPGLQNEYTAVVKEDSTPTTGNDWVAVREHWEAVAKSHKEEDAAVSVTNQVLPKPTPAAAAVQKSVGPSLRKVDVVTSAPTLKSPQPRKSALKKSTTALQTRPAPEPQMRKSMRGGPGPQTLASPDTRMRQSMRSGEASLAPRATLGLASSRNSMPPIESRPRGALLKKNISVAAAAASAPKPRPQSMGNPVTTKAKAPVYDSDSDASVSSFQRQRAGRNRGKSGQGGQYTMRGSMRSDAVSTMRATPAMRPISPPTFASSPPPSSFRKSLRPSSPTPEPAATKSSRFSIRSLSPGRKFRSKPSKSNVPPMPAPKPRLNSRFDDSSDEELETRPRHFQSRFADSDDDEEVFALPTELTPVRGIPKRSGDEDRDSTDLEDEDSDVEASAAKDVEKEPSNGSILGLQKSKYATELPAFGPGKMVKAKRGFFGLGKKKTVVTAPGENHVNSVSNQAPDIPMPPAHRDRSRSHDRNRPLTPIGEDKTFEASPSSRPPKLQRRSTPQWGRTASGSWPLPEASDDGRPQSADGANVKRASFRPIMTPRHSSLSGVPANPVSDKNVIVGHTGKKKKFQGLRRVFGLND